MYAHSTLIEAQEVRYLSDDCETWADLTVAYTKNPKLREHLKQLLDSRRKVYREDPENNQQPELPLFSLPLSDISVKDELSLMEVAAFSLSTKPQFETIIHQLKNGKITITGSSEYGIATVYDYDIVLYMISHLAYQMNLVKKQAEQGKTPLLPPRTFMPDITTLLKFCRRPKGGKQYKWVEGALNRLRFTGIVSTLTGDLRESISGSYINDYKILSRTKTGDVLRVKIDIPNWIYDGIVRPTTPRILTINPDYFLLREGLHRFLHRFARKTAGKSKSIYSVKDIHSKSASQRELKYFTRDLKKSIQTLEKSPLPDYSIKFISKGRGNNYVEFQYIGQEKVLPKINNNSAGKQKTELPKIKENTWSLAKAEAPNYDVQYLYEEWIKFWQKKGEKLHVPDKAFIAFCKKRHKEKPIP